MLLNESPHPPAVAVQLLREQSRDCAGFHTGLVIPSHIAVIKCSVRLRLHLPKRKLSFLLASQLSVAYAMNPFFPHPHQPHVTSSCIPRKDPWNYHLYLYSTTHQDESHQGPRPRGLTRGDSSIPNTTMRATVSCSPIAWAFSVSGICTKLRGSIISYEVRQVGLEYCTAAPSFCSYKGRDQMQLQSDL